jgi:hypothetical protein
MFVFEQLATMCVYMTGASPVSNNRRAYFLILQEDADLLSRSATYCSGSKQIARIKGLFRGENPRINVAWPRTDHWTKPASSPV